MSAKGLFITGTDTDVGKTHVASMLVRALVDKGHKVGVMKPVASGCEWHEGQWKNADALSMIQAGNLEISYDLVNPYAFEEAIAPHIAAQQAGANVELNVIAACYAQIAERADYVVVEGAGGWLVPLNSHQYMSDVAKALDLPVLLVAAVRLGWLNHSLLSLESIQQRGCRLSMLVANSIGPETMPFYTENLKTLEYLVGGEKLTALGHQEDSLILKPHQSVESLFHA